MGIEQVTDIYDFYVLILTLSRVLRYDSQLLIISFYKFNVRFQFLFTCLSIPEKNIVTQIINNTTRDTHSKIKFIIKNPNHKNL